MVTVTEGAVLSTIAPGDVIQLSGVFGGGMYARVRERVSRGLVVVVAGVSMLVTGTERRDHARPVVDVDSIEPWQVPTPRRARARRPRPEPQAEGA
jgi:hypothetical protein